MGGWVDGCEEVKEWMSGWIAGSRGWYGIDMMG